MTLMLPWLVDAVIVVFVVETLLLAALRRPLLLMLAPQLAAGLALVLGVRAAIGDSSALVAACMALAGAAHGYGVWRDWKAS